MAGKITGLSYQKGSQDRVNVYLDEIFAFALPATTAARLHPGQEVSDAEIAELKAGDAEQRAFERAVTFLSYRPRSRAEVQRNLAGAGIAETLVEKVIGRLEDQGLVNDEDFARFWVEDRERFQPRGARALRQELRLKGVDSSTVAGAVGEVGTVDSACRAAASRARRLWPLVRTDPAGFRRKLHDFLLRRGFDSDIVWEAIARLEAELGSDSPSGEAD